MQFHAVPDDTHDYAPTIHPLLVGQYLVVTQTTKILLCHYVERCEVLAGGGDVILLYCGRCRKSDNTHRLTRLGFAPDTHSR